VFHIKSRFFTLKNSLRLLPHNLLSFSSFKTENPINPSQRLWKCNPIMNVDSRINKYTKNKQNKTMIMISQVAMQIPTNCGQNEDMK